MGTQNVMIGDPPAQIPPTEAHGTSKQYVLFFLGDITNMREDHGLQEGGKKWA